LSEQIKIESYSIIYGIDGDYPDNYTPNNKKLWKLTEKGKSDLGIPRWTHKKYVAILTPKQFDEFIDETGLFADCETMGSLGAPGYGFGWSPAINFTSEQNDALISAYVTPNISKTEYKRLKQLYGEDKIWDIITKQLFDKYGL
jgi:hypothetical protein